MQMNQQRCEHFPRAPLCDRSYDDLSITQVQQGPHSDPEQRRESLRRVETAVTMP